VPDCYASLPDQVLPLKIPSKIETRPEKNAIIKRESRHFEIEIFDEYHSFITSEWDSFCLENNWMIWQTKDNEIYRQYAGFCSYDWLHDEFKMENGKMAGLAIESNMEHLQANPYGLLSEFDAEKNTLPVCKRDECMIFRHTIMLEGKNSREIFLTRIQPNGKYDQWNCIE